MFIQNSQHSPSNIYTSDLTHTGLQCGTRQADDEHIRTKSSFFISSRSILRRLSLAFLLSLISQFFKRWWGARCQMLAYLSHTLLHAPNTAQRSYKPHNTYGKLLPVGYSRFLYTERLGKKHYSLANVLYLNRSSTQHIRTYASTVVTPILPHPAPPPVPPPDAHGAPQELHPWPVLLQLPSVQDWTQSWCTLHHWWDPSPNVMWLHQMHHCVTMSQFIAPIELSVLHSAIELCNRSCHYTVGSAGSRVIPDSTFSV